MSKQQQQQQTTGAERRAERRERRARHAAEVRALDAVRRMARHDDDVTSAALVAAFERAERESTGRPGGADPVAEAARIVRQTRTDLARADVARMAREAAALDVADGLTGAPVTMAAPVREHRSVRAARVVWQHRANGAPGCPLVAALDAWREVWHREAPGAPDVERERAEAAREALRHRCTGSATYERGTGRWSGGVERVEVSTSCGACAVAAALDADGPSARPDHDAAGCARPGCRKCAALRRTGVAAGPLVRAHKRGARVEAQHRAPRERTTARAVELIREADVATALDVTRAMGASRPFEPSDPTGRDATDPRHVAEIAADLAIVATVGRRGTMVAWHEAALRYGVDVEAWRALVVGLVAERAALPLDVESMRRHARAAGLSVAAYATARSEAERIRNA